MKGDKEPLLITYRENDSSNSSRPIFMTARTFAVCTVSLPLISFISCIAISFILHFEASTATHCRVPNYLPSISAATGSYSPEKYIWRIGIAIHTTPRYLVALLYHSYYKVILSDQPWGGKWSNILCILHIIEVSSLVGLTYISSTENYAMHEKMFISFMACALLYMFFSTVIGKSALRPQSSSIERKSLKFKTIFFLVNIISFLTAIYFFFRHNLLCEPGMYTLFCFFEYIVVLSNMAFHLTAYWDFHDHVFVMAHSSSVQVTSSA